ncbi:MAG: hypothetical protein AVDCRST_MAG19-3825, partial [uncultured Thermomicrobiales bacterium]
WGSLASSFPTRCRRTDMSGLPLTPPSGSGPCPPAARRGSEVRHAARDRERTDDSLRVPGGGGT